MAAPLTNSAISRLLIAQQHDHRVVVSFLTMVLDKLWTAAWAHGDQQRCATLMNVLVKSKAPARLTLLQRP